jgi:hypothetical protein
MFKLLQPLFAALILTGVGAGVSRADSYDDTIQTFKQAGKSGTFFAKAYGYAVFPTVGGAGFVIGAAHGKGRIYARGALTGDTTMNLISAVAITAGAEAGAGTSGVSSEASAESSNANTSGHYFNGMAVFTIAKGGLMYAATISGQRFTYTPRGGN